MKPPMRFPVEVFTTNNSPALYSNSAFCPTDYTSRSVVPRRNSSRKVMVSAVRDGNSYSRYSTSRPYSYSPILKMGWNSFNLLPNSSLASRYLVACSARSIYSILLWLFRYYRYLVMNYTGR
jgi:hypothetical protein